MTKTGECSSLVEYDVADTRASKSQTSNKKEHLNGGHELDAGGDGGGDGDGVEDEECDMEAWSTLSKAFKQVQAVLDQNRDLIQKVNENHRSKIPDNPVKNVALIGEINGNISKVLGIYSDLSVNFSDIVHRKRKKRDEDMQGSGS
ncbi:hypothetical protein SLA2020_253860 [Shorea laevis]